LNFENEIPRMFSRLVLAGINPVKLQNKTVAILGVGGIGTVIAETLARVGVGKLILVDKDLVGPENLNRLGFSPSDIGLPKAEAFAKKLLEFNKTRKHLRLDVEWYHVNVINWPKLDAIVRSADVIVTSFDNLDARLEVNERIVKNRKILIDCGTSLDGWSGRVNVVIPGKTPCLACYYDPNIIYGESESWWTAPCGASLPTTMTIVASLASDQVLRILLNLKGVYSRILVSLRNGIVVHAKNMKKRPNCEVCGEINE